MRCKSCNAQIENYDIYCPKCAKKTQSIKENFSTVKVIRSSFEQIKKSDNDSRKFNLLYTFVMLLFVGSLVFHYFFSEYTNSYMKYGVENLIYLIFTPLLLVPFGAQNQAMEVGYGKELYRFMGRSLPKYFIFVLLNILFFALFKFLCIGDPILKIVRVVLNCWWVSVQLPIASLLTKKKGNFFKLLKMSYKGLQDLRWQMFFTWVILLFANVAMILPLFIGFIMYGQLSALATSNLVDKIIENNVIEKYMKD